MVHERRLEPSDGLQFPRWQYVSVQQPQPQYVQYVVQQVHFHAPILTHQPIVPALGASRQGWSIETR